MADNGLAKHKATKETAFQKKITGERGKNGVQVLITASSFSSLVFALILASSLFFFVSTAVCWNIFYIGTFLSWSFWGHTDETVSKHVCATGVGIASAIEVDIYRVTSL